MAISQIYLFILLGQFIGVLEKRENGRDVRRPPLERKCIETLYKFKNIIHLAAQAGVRYSIKNPSLYVKSNLVGFGNILENSKNHNIKHLIYASSSSVYGVRDKKKPFSEKDPVDHPIQFYAATKRSNELMAHAYSHLFNMPTTGIRFFTAYGPWGRPDMALYKFTENISLSKKSIKTYIFQKS